MQVNSASWGRLIMMPRFAKVFLQLLPNGHAFLAPFYSMMRKIIYSTSAEFDRVKTEGDLLQNDAYPQITTRINDHEDMLAYPSQQNLTDEQRRQRISSRRSAIGGQSTEYFKSIFLGLDLVIGVTENQDRNDPASIIAAAAGNTFGNGESFGGLNKTGTKLTFSGGRVYLVDYDLRIDEPSRDPDDWTFYFFIHNDDGINTPLRVPNEIKNEFIDNILRYKPAHSVAILFVEFS